MFICYDSLVEKKIKFYYTLLIAFESKELSRTFAPDASVKNLSPLCDVRDHFTECNKKAVDGSSHGELRLFWTLGLTEPSARPERIKVDRFQRAALGLKTGWCFMNSHLDRPFDDLFTKLGYVFDETDLLESGPHPRLLCQ